MSHAIGTLHAIIPYYVPLPHGYPLPTPRPPPPTPRPPPDRWLIRTNGKKRTCKRCQVRQTA